jgi:hypothetical protein
MRPVLREEGLPDGYRLLAEFNDTVLAGLDVYALNPLVTHANQNINILNIHNDKLDARRIALLGLRPDLKTSIVPADEVAAVKALLREYHAMKKETSMYICRLKNQLRQIFPQYLPLFSQVKGQSQILCKLHLGCK